MKRCAEELYQVGWLGWFTRVHVVCSASNSGVLIDVVTHWGVRCRLRRERYFFQAQALRLSSVQGDDSRWQFLAPLPLSPRQVKSPPPSSSLSLLPSSPASLALSPSVRFLWVTSLLTRSHHPQTVSVTTSLLAPDAASPFQWELFFHLFSQGHFYIVSVTI